MTTRRTARNARTARSAVLVAVAAAAALSLTACQSGGSDDTGSEKKNSSSSSGSTGNGGSHNGTKTSADKSEADKTETDSPAAKSATEPAGGSNSAVPDRTEDLADGVSKAEIYELGEQHYRVDIVARGSVLATLETDEHDAGLDANDMFVVVTLGGEVRSWMGGGHQGPGTFKLEGGWTAKVTKLGELRYRAEILGNEGDVEATLETDQQDVGLDANGSSIVLSAGGVISSNL
ncbi:hypothetical protein ACLVWQ_20270 [Streptomyces sp. CWNU-52B]|uniref:hypothetical protein n=1 Tax=unclassified Streptomyces TaxID=2593676 RepID=UPI0039C17A85